MKRIYLLLLGAFALATNAMAVNWPADYADVASTGWFSTADAIEASRPEPKVATAKSLETFALPEDEAAFDAAYAAIDGEESVNNLRNGQIVIAGDATFKSIYTEDAIYFLVQYVPTSGSLPDAYGVEIMLSPYDKLVAENLTNEGCSWLRYFELGASKLSLIKADAESDFGFENFMACLNDGTAINPSTAFGPKDFYAFENYSTSEVLKVAVKFEFLALDNDKDKIPFSYAFWKEANDGKGISFDLKVKKDVKNGAESEYFWNASGAKNNNVYFSNFFAGYLKPGFLFSADKTATAAANLSVKGDLIQLVEAGNIQIFSAAGILISSQSNVSLVSTAGLAPGVYIAVSGNESVSFVK